MAIASLAGKIFVHAKTLKEAEFILKLSTKVSKTSYTNCVNDLVLYLELECTIRLP